MNRRIAPALGGLLVVAVLQNASNASGQVAGIALISDREAEWRANRAKYVRWYHRTPGSENVDAPSTDEVAASLRDRLEAISTDIMNRQAVDKNVADAWAGRRSIDSRSRLPDGTLTELVSVRGGIQFYVTHNAAAADTTSTDELWPGGSTSLDLTGEGVEIGMWDAGDVRLDHHEFSEEEGPRVIDYDGASSFGMSDHATHVAGTLAGAGINAAARGMAPSAKVDAYDWASDLGEMGLAGLLISNHSYSYQTGWGAVTVQGVSTPAWFGNTAISQTEDFRFGFYRQIASEVDRITYNAQTYLPVWAVGNERGTPGQAPVGHESGHYAYDGTSLVWTTGVSRPDDGGEGGYDTIPENGVAKNILTVGAVADILGGYRSPSQVNVSTFSSFGPTDDGRIKPDLVANGEDVLSSFAGSDDAYGELPGTSMAAPNVAGSLALLIERQAQSTSQPMWASTLKGLAIHTADESGEVDGPDYQHGWGLLNTVNAVNLLGANLDSGSLAHVKEVTLPDGDFIEFPIVSDGSPLRVTICWNDPPGQPPEDGVDPADLMLINDLDLRIKNTAATFEPWILDPISPFEGASVGDNVRDNVEQVFIRETQPGAYLVSVTHKGNLVDEDGVVSFQNVSILVSGNVAQPNAGPIILEADATGAEEMSLLWSVIVGRVYQVQYSESLTDASWMDTGKAIHATKHRVAAVVAAPSQAPQRFFRVVEVTEE